MILLAEYSWETEDGIMFDASLFLYSNSSIFKACNIKKAWEINKSTYQSKLMIDDGGLHLIDNNISKWRIPI